MQNRFAQNRFIRAALLLTTLAAPLGLAACADQGPWPMPTGYTYEHGRYHAAPGPQPVMKEGLETPYTPTSAGTTSGNTMTTSTTMTTSSETNSMAGGTMSGPAGALLDQLFGNFGKPAEAVWILPAPGAAPSPELETQLRTALTAKDVQVAETAGNGPFGLRYATTPADGGRSHVTLDLTSGGMKAATASGDIDLGGGTSMSTTHVSESRSMQTTTSSAADIPAGPSNMPPMADKPVPLSSMHLND